MFRKILIANRGEIAVRIIQTCREMGIATVALYQEPDEISLHVRLSDECVLLKTPAGFMDQTEILRIASEKDADAIHPGIGFLSENLGFIRACEAAGIAFIGPSSAVIERVSDKLDALARVRTAGFPAVTTSAESYSADDVAAMRAEAERLGYPIVVKSCSGGRGPGARLVHTAGQLATALRRARTEAQLVYGVERFYLEKAVLPAHQIGVQVLADKYGQQVHLEEREGSMLRNGQKVIEESPAPCLSPDQRAALWAAALQIAALFGHENVGTVEFLVDEERRFHFAEIKPRLQIEHPLTEMRARIDLVREQIRLAAGEPLGFAQADLHPRGWAILCRVNAEDPLNQLPSPGAVRVRLPFGAEVRVDTYIADHGWVPHDYNSLIAKVTAWAAERDICLRRMERALQDFWLPGRTNLPLLRQMLNAPGVRAGDYFARSQEQPASESHDEAYLRDMAAVAAALHSGQYRTLVDDAVPERVLSGWHRDSRRLPE